jgi:hypothetical protein
MMVGEGSQEIAAAIETWIAGVLAGSTVASKETSS